MDDVLVNIDSCWLFIHRALGVDSRNNLEKYLHGEIDYKEFMRRDIHLWGHVHIDKIKNILDNAPLMNGSKEVIHDLKRATYKTAIISAGISILADRVKENLGIDYSFANGIVIDEKGMLTGEGEEIVKLGQKMITFKRLIDTENIIAKQCAFVGNDVYDIPLLKEAGFSIAFNAKNEEVNKAADIIIKEKDLRKILPYFV